MGQLSSFHRACGSLCFGGTGMNLFQPFGLVPPTVPTDPVSTASRNRHRLVCHPPRLPAAEARQLWEANRPRWRPTTTATSRICSASMPHTRAASSGVCSA